MIDSRSLPRPAAQRARALSALLAWGPAAFAATLLLACSAPAPIPPPASPSVDQEAFEALLQTLASSWNAGDARRAAECFTTDAIYTQPPHQQLHRGRDALYRFFGGDDGRPGDMKMTWHRLAFDPEAQQGFGEFSFRYGTQVHGIAVVDLEDGLIAQWREYWVLSEEPFEDFVAPSRP